MAKKKKGGKKKKKKKNGDGAEANETNPEMVKAAEALEKELAVGILEYQVKETEARYQEACAHRDEIMRASLEDKKTRKDMEFFLNKKLDDQYNEIDRLEKKVLEMESEKDSAEKRWTESLDSERMKMESKVTEVTNQMKIHEQELLKLKEFRKTRNETFERMRKMEIELSFAREKMEKRLVEVDKRRVRERQNLEKEFERRLERTKTECAEKSMNMLHETTQKAIAENTRMRAELKYQSKATEKLMNTNSALVEENAKLRQEVELQEKIKNDFAKKIDMYKKLVETVTEEKEIKMERAQLRVQNLEERDQQLTEEACKREEELKMLRDACKTHKRHTKEARLECRDLRAQLREVQLQRKMEKSSRSSLLSLLLAFAQDESGVCNEAKRSARTGVFVRGVGSGEAPPSMFGDLDREGRREAIEILLSHLGSERVELLREAEAATKRARTNGSSGNNIPDNAVTHLPPLAATPKRSPSATKESEAVRFKMCRDAGVVISAGTQTSDAELASLSPIRPEMVTSDTKPWGARSKCLPHTLHTQATYLRARGKKNGR